MRGMSKPLISDELWHEIEPLFPAARPRPQGGRPPISDRAKLTGILFVLKTGMPWEMLPGELGCGSGMTCWRALRDWQQAGLWSKLHQRLLDRLNEAGQIDWSIAALDSTSVPPPRGARKPVRIQRIAANRARNAIWWSTDKVSR